MTQRIVLLPVFLVLLGIAAGCHHKSDQAPLDPALIHAADDAASDRVAALRSEVHKRIEINARTMAEDKQHLIHRTPYWYKEYSEYPAGSDNFEVQTADTESRAAPMTGAVSLDKIRFSTRLHRDRDEAEHDTNFLRDTGAEKLAYTFRNGRWILTGSTFVADKSEENVNGQWVAVQETVQRTVAKEEKPGWFARTWATITGK
mgnify:CR=1 FL=1